MSKKIALDAGHGLNTSGKQTPDGIKEWSLNDKVRDKVVAFLSEYDCEIIHTDNNEGNTDESLSARTNKYLNAGVDCFVSIHHNAYNGKWNNATGVEVFTDKTPTDADTRLAKCIYERLVKYTGLKGRGIKKENWWVINQNKIPAVLVEGGFMDGSNDYKVITSDVGQTSYAKAVAEGIVEFLGLKKKTTVTTPVEAPKTEKTSSVKKGDLVSIKENATYYNGKSVPAWVKSQKWYVSEVNGDRAVIDKNEKGTNSISSPINVSYLTVVSASAPISTPAPTPAPAPTPTIKVGSTVRLNKGAKTYEGKSLASFVYNRNHKVKEIKGDRVVITYLGVTVAAVNIKDLTLA